MVLDVGTAAAVRVGWGTCRSVSAKNRKASKASSLGQKWVYQRGFTKKRTRRERLANRHLDGCQLLKGFIAPINNFQRPARLAMTHNPDDKISSCFSRDSEFFCPMRKKKKKNSVCRSINWSSAVRHLQYPTIIPGRVDWLTGKLYLGESNALWDLAGYLH